MRIETEQRDQRERLDSWNDHTNLSLVQIIGQGHGVASQPHHAYAATRVLSEQSGTRRQPSGSHR
jgi:hypothetical protein